MNFCVKLWIRSAGPTEIRNSIPIYAEETRCRQSICFTGEGIICIPSEEKSERYSHHMILNGPSLDITLNHPFGLVLQGQFPEYKALCSPNFRYSDFISMELHSLIINAATTLRFIEASRGSGIFFVKMYSRRCALETIDRFVLKRSACYIIS